MVAVSANGAGDCPRDPPAEACRRKERDQWLRRRLLQRQLHDGAALRISALTLHLGLLRHRALDGQAVRSCIDELQNELHTVLEELRDIAAKIYPPLLDEAGLVPALREVVDQLEIPVAVVASGERFGPAAEGAAYFAMAQCLAALSAGAQSTTVVVRRDNNELMLSVSGIDACHAELMDDQIWPLGGTVEIADVVDGVGPGAGTITVRIPCE
ncbi:MAG TPA: histidine kinase [Pseudonocardiaceae bacterium]|jgi:signal transduction histidine kinase|nr:histidine kinase [Pseudonocardiaceae bacterium]